MRWLSVSLLFAALSLAAVVSANWKSAAQGQSTFAAEMLAEHNAVRQKYGVQPLVWDEGLAKLAQEWADKIAASGAMPPPHRASGENLFWGTADAWSPKDILEVWENEVKNFTLQYIGTTQLTCSCAPGRSCLHYTQVVWSTTTRVGCGKAKGMGKDEPTDFFVCDYSPAGNTVGQCPFPPPNAGCDDLRQSVQQLTAEVERLKNPNSESAKVATPTPSPSTPKTDPSAKCPTNKYGIELLPIPGKSFCMGKYEVTQAQWKSVMGYNRSNFKGDTFPVEQVTWYEAQDFVNQLNAANDGFTYRLPNEEEWEYSCRAGTTGRFYGDLDEISWFQEEEDDASGRFGRARHSKTHAVGGKQPNAFGLYDMTGNVWEWCEDWYDEDDKDMRVLRGGSWHSYPERRLSSSFRSGIRPNDSEDYVGFRVAASRSMPTNAALAPTPTPSPTPRPVARQMGSEATPTPASTSNANATCEELRKTEQELIAQVEELKKPKPKDPNARCPANKNGIEFLPIPGQIICLGKYEVTQAQWKLLMGRNPSDFEGDNFPVENVSWKDAQEFIDKLNAGNDGFKYRLPTDAEWEYACRAGTTGLYYGDVNDIGWHKRNSGNHPHAVGGKLPNAFGLYDMSGNVSEWVQDGYDEKNWERGLRGGSWYDLTQKLRSGNKGGMYYYRRRNYIGFRVAVERAR